MTNEYREKIRERMGGNPSGKETVYVVEFLMPVEWIGEGKRLELAEKKYKSKGWAESFFEKKPLAYRLLKAKEEILEDESVLGGPFKRQSEMETLKTKRIQKSELEEYYVPNEVERTLGELMSK